MSKKYTAQEMRDMANTPIYISSYYSMRMQHLMRDMLLQAAEILERAKQVRSSHSLYYGKIDYEHDTAIVDEVDYILHGDTGK